MQQQEKERTLARLMLAMTGYDRGDVPRIQHLVKVHDFARTIALAEGMDPDRMFILEAAAILHDVGIHAAEALYGNSNGKHQEELGPAEAMKVMASAGVFTDREKERICWLIAHHHTYSPVADDDHRILLEADFLVNSFEDHLSREGILTFRDKVFRSPPAISLLQAMWNI